jgi:DNA helicase-2/ATP-dependent DNA helicase PcrA
VVDFTELLLRSFELLNYNPSILAKYHQQFRHILIDEFQDTNALQYKWLKLLRSKNCSIFAVGDDDQSIYSFRGAQVDNMQKFIQDFGATNPIRLEQNYRSNNNILAIANALIAHNTTRIGKTLWTDNTNEIPIYWQELFNENAESRFVIEQIKQLNKQGVDYSQIAVLYRSNAQSRVIEQELYKEKIPYRVYGGLRFFDREEIKHILAYLRLIINRDDDNALLRIINVPPRKIGNKTLEVLQQMAQIKQLSLFESIKQLAGSVRTKLDKFAELIEDLHIQIDKLELSQLLVYIIEQTGLKDHYLALGNEGVNRLENLSQLVSAVAEFAKVSSTEFILDFLTNSVLDNDILHDSGEENVVRLMTVHASKGLEFKAVFIVGLEDGLFPHQNALQLKSGEEEERRLMYVAVTRAREHLYLTRACSRLMWGTQYTSPVSRFISEIPASHLVSLPIARQDYI